MKISLIPAPIRAQINHRLQSGEASPSILAWLNSHPDVQSLTAGSFAGQPVNEDDLNTWQHCIYRDSRLHATTLQAAECLAANSAELNLATTSPLTEQLAACLAAALAAVWLRPPARHASGHGGPSSEEDSLVPLQRVEELSTHLVRLRRGDQNAQWLQIQRQWVNLASQKHQDRLAAQKSKYDQFLNPRPHDGGFTKETIAKIAEDLNLF